MLWLNGTLTFKNNLGFVSLHRAFGGLLGICVLVLSTVVIPAVAVIVVTVYGNKFHIFECQFCHSRADNMKFVIVINVLAAKSVLSFDRSRGRLATRSFAAL